MVGSEDERKVNVRSEVTSRLARDLNRSQSGCGTRYGNWCDGEGGH